MFPLPLNRKMDQQSAALAVKHMISNWDDGEISIAQSCTFNENEVTS